MVEEAIVIIKTSCSRSVRRFGGENVLILWSDSLTTRYNSYDMDACSWGGIVFVPAELLLHDTGEAIAHFQEDLEVSDLREFASSDGYVFCVRTEQTSDRNVYAIDLERPFVQTKIIARSVDYFCDWHLILLAIEVDRVFASRNSSSFREILELQTDLDIGYWTESLDICLVQTQNG